MANEDHTTLLINCYTKLKDTKKLDEFTGATAAKAKDTVNSNGPNVEYDVDIVIKVCRQAGYNQVRTEGGVKKGCI